MKTKAPVIQHAVNSEPSGMFLFRRHSRVSAIAAFCLAIGTSAWAQTTREDWVAHREAKQQRSETIHSELIPKSVAGRVAVNQADTVASVLALLSTHSFPDSQNNLVVVGEVQNVSPYTLSFSKAMFTFRNASGVVGSDYDYVFGSQNGKLALTGSFVDVLPPGAVGFFKVWTTIPAGLVSSFVFSSTAETYALSPVGANVEPLGPPGLSVDILGFTDYSGAVRNSARTSATYFTRVALAGYRNGAIADVDFTYVNGLSGVCGVGNSTSGMLPGTTASYSGFFLEPVAAIGRIATEWDECAVPPPPALTGVTISADRTSPRSSGETITFSATGTGGTAPYAFKFLLTTNNWASYTVLSDWSTTPTVAWTPSSAASYQIGVWGRSAWDTADGPEAAAAMPFAILQPTMTSASIAADKASPQTTGSTVTFSASGAGGAAPYSFKFLVTSDNWTTFAVAREWSTIATFAWTPTSPGAYQVGVWARSAGNAANVPERAAAIGFTVAAQLTVATHGSGTVTTADAAIQCPGGACSHSYTGGAAVTLQATPQAGFVFAGWSSPACSSGTVVMTADMTCGATFVPAVAGGPRRGSLDLNGSGFGDVLTYNPRTGTRTFQFSDGLTHFGEVRAGWPAGLGVYPADFNGDGLTDFLVYAAASGGWSKAINTGGDFTYFNGPAWSAGASIFIVDLNADQHSDAFVSNPATGAWSWCLSSGAGTAGFACTTGQWPAGLSIYPTDFNGDGRADFFLYNARTGQWSQALNDGGNGFTYTSGAWGAGLSVIPGDFNGDGRGDFFVYSPATGRWSVVTTLPSLQFAYTSGTWSVGWTLTPGDFNGDGKTDLLLYNPANGWWYEGISSGSGDFALTFGTWSANWQPLVADFNNDGVTDVLLYNPTSGQWYQAVNTGVGSFTYGSGFWDPSLNVLASTPLIP